MEKCHTGTGKNIPCTNDTRSNTGMKPKEGEMMRL